MTTLVDAGGLASLVLMEGSMLESRAVKLAPLDESDPRMKELTEQYRHLPMDLAAAALVRVAERECIRRVFTTDRRDLLVYRPTGLKHFVVVP